ncbi:hypothetical protein C8J57DRAFT_1512760 [Mycena rebaudengoi]|nr:hypothetical protein C8J57DRAFT_1512760 [Mycena rebaudengoi]
MELASQLEESPVTNITTLEHAKPDYILPKTSEALQKGTSCIIHRQTPTASVRGSKDTGPVPREPHQNLVQRIRAARTGPAATSTASSSGTAHNPEHGGSAPTTISASRNAMDASLPSAATTPPSTTFPTRSATIRGDGSPPHDAGTPRFGQKGGAAHDTHRTTRSKDRYNAELREKRRWYSWKHAAPQMTIVMSPDATRASHPLRPPQRRRTHRCRPRPPPTPFTTPTRSQFGARRENYATATALPASFPPLHWRRSRRPSADASRTPHRVDNKRERARTTLTPRRLRRALHGRGALRRPIRGHNVRRKHAIHGQGRGGGGGGDRNAEIAQSSLRSLHAPQLPRPAFHHPSSGNPKSARQPCRQVRSTTPRTHQRRCHPPRPRSRTHPSTQNVRKPLPSASFTTTTTTTSASTVRTVVTSTSTSSCLNLDRLHLHHQHQHFCVLPPRLDLVPRVHPPGATSHSTKVQIQILLPHSSPPSPLPWEHAAAPSRAVVPP